MAKLIKKLNAGGNNSYLDSGTILHDKIQLSNIINDINQKIGWKFFKSVYDKTETSLPSEFNEIFILTQLRLSPKKIVTINVIPKIALPDNLTEITLGGRYTIDTGAGVIALISKTRFYVDSIYFNKKLEDTSLYQTDIYYR